MTLTRIEESLLVAAYFRGGSRDDRGWTSDSDQILTLSLFYTGDISAADCVSRFAKRGYVGKLYVDVEEWTEEVGWGILMPEIATRYRILIDLLRGHAELIEGGGNFETPAHPTFTACRLTPAGLDLAARLIGSFPRKPDFQNWPDRRESPGG
jgi:hypothetical protein